jgi:hypothetical protein
MTTCNICGKKEATVENLEEYMEADKSARDPFPYPWHWKHDLCWKTLLAGHRGYGLTAKIQCESEITVDLAPVRPQIERLVKMVRVCYESKTTDHFSGKTSRILPLDPENVTDLEEVEKALGLRTGVTNETT